MNNFHRIIWYHKCVCGILFRKLKKYSKYTMKTCPENLWHIYMMCHFIFSHRMTYAGLVKRAKSHFENCNNGPEETPLQGDCSYILTPRATGAARPSPAGPECKKILNSDYEKLWIVAATRLHAVTMIDMKSKLHGFLRSHSKLNQDIRSCFFRKYAPIYFWLN